MQVVLRGEESDQKPRVEPSRIGAEEIHAMVKRSPTFAPLHDLGGVPSDAQYLGQQHVARPDLDLLVRRVSRMLLPGASGPDRLAQQDEGAAADEIGQGSAAPCP